LKLLVTGCQDWRYERFSVGLVEHRCAWGAVPATARRVLEFGTLVKYSTIWSARAVETDGQVVTLELEESNAAIARKNFERANVADRVVIAVGPAIELAQQHIDDGVEPFGLVFIDADKPRNPQYLAASLQLTSSGAVIVIDNVVRDSAVILPDAGDPRVQGVRNVVDDIMAHPNLEATAIQTVGVKGWDGLILARRR
jgi:predicted O-methyltransferase YrrM